MMVFFTKLSRILTELSINKKTPLFKFYNCIVIRNAAGNVNDETKTTLLSRKTGTFRIFCVDEYGLKSHHKIEKSTLYHKLGLTMRDLRFHHSNMLFVRNKKIIFRFQDLKLVICPDAIILIDPPFKDESDSKSSIAEFWRSLPSLIRGSMLYTNNLPLEYRALEAVFMHVQFEFSLYLSKVEPEITKLLSILTDPKNLVVDRSLVHILLKNNTKLNHFSTQLNEFCEAIEEILEHEDDIRAFCISSAEGKINRSQLDAYVFTPSAEEVSSDIDERFELRFPSMMQYKYKINMQDEMENLLDSYLRDVEEISNLVKELKDAIDNSTTTILINLDSHRNMLLRFELELTIGMFSCTVFGLIGMAFGMNLSSALEEHALAFWYASAVMVGGSGLLWRYLLNLSRKPLPNTNDFLKTAETVERATRTEHRSLRSFANTLTNRQRTGKEKDTDLAPLRQSGTTDDEFVEYEDAKTIANAVKEYRRSRTTDKRFHRSVLTSERMKPLSSSMKTSGLFEQPVK